LGKALEMSIYSTLIRAPQFPLLVLSEIRTLSRSFFRLFSSNQQLIRRSTAPQHHRRGLNVKRRMHAKLMCPNTTYRRVVLLFFVITNAPTRIRTQAATHGAAPNYLVTVVWGGGGGGPPPRGGGGPPLVGLQCGLEVATRFRNAKM